MTQSNFNVKDGQVTSSILDAEQALDNASQAQFDAEKFARYALIGDAMRSQQNQAPYIDITASLADALADEPTHGAQSQQQKPQQTNAKNKVVALSSWRKPLAQVAIAASVSLVAVLGVSNYSPQEQANSDFPVLQSTPLTGSVSPVSLSSEPALESAEKGLRELQQQRIGALVLEHQRQSRMAHALTQQAQEEEEQEK
ncbi:anti-sigma 24 factor [Pseudoalteromonas rubra]|uniref:Anti-sigma-E factor RseA n=1 Tax=Pseudoalteromonas rubra TaxID=43658 RepID=A0A5S3WJT9_9GAMM|nr:RseA family anti-sigma factor [Pseudoalteromonas rubra]TMP27388.1 anti-sigma 24 factor [Pseudoalteromonas rubra]TMP36926.1 anti-sigma 24 factor [Pseudoalteromonas rubra]